MSKVGERRGGDMGINIPSCYHFMGPNRHARRRGGAPITVGVGIRGAVQR